jgi:hypothetical protein
MKVFNRCFGDNLIRFILKHYLFYMILQNSSNGIARLELSTPIVWFDLTQA